jgi:hypothetical protein
MGNICYAGNPVSKLEQCGTLRTIDDNAHNTEAALRSEDVCVHVT